MMPCTTPFACGLLLEHLLSQPGWSDLTVEELCWIRPEAWLEKQRRKNR